MANLIMPWLFLYGFEMAGLSRMFQDQSIVEI